MIYFRKNIYANAINLMHNDQIWLTFNPDTFGNKAQMWAIIREKIASRLKNKMNLNTKEKSWVIKLSKVRKQILNILERLTDIYLQDLMQC